MLRKRATPARPHFTRNKIKAAFIPRALRTIPDQPVAISTAGTLVGILGYLRKTKIFHSEVLFYTQQ